jgi:hypothetical protein
VASWSLECLSVTNKKSEFQIFYISTSKIRKDIIFLAQINWLHGTKSAFKSCQSLSHLNSLPFMLIENSLQWSPPIAVPSRTNLYVRFGVSTVKVYIVAFWFIRACRALKAAGSSETLANTYHNTQNHNQTNPVTASDPIFLTSILMLSPMHAHLFQGFSSFQILCACFNFPVPATYPIHLSINLITLIIFREEHEL